MDAFYKTKRILLLCHPNSLMFLAAIVTVLLRVFEFLLYLFFPNLIFTEASVLLISFLKTYNICTLNFTKFLYL